MKQSSMPFGPQHAEQGVTQESLLRQPQCAFFVTCPKSGRRARKASERFHPSQAVTENRLRASAAQRNFRMGILAA